MSNASFYYVLFVNGERVSTRFNEENALLSFERHKEHGFDVRLVRYFDGPREEAFRYAVVEWNSVENKWELLRRELVLRIVNLTQHSASSEQMDAGVFNLEGRELDNLRCYLTFDSLPSAHEVERRADSIAEIARRSGAQYAMIGGAPFLMSALESALMERGITPLYAFSRRVAVEESLPDGSVKKTTVFRHEGFVNLSPPLCD